MSEEPVAQGNQSQGEYIKFVILVIIMVGTVAVIALLRPLIFGQIVPAVLGEDIILPTATIAPTDTPAPQTQEAEAPTTDENSNPSTETIEDGESPVEGETAATEMPPAQYVVLRGDTLANIAYSYGVTVEEIVQANNLTNAALIQPGMVLLIPQTND